MRKKKQIQAFKQGMEAGTIPFVKKFEETAKQIRQTSGHMNELARNQRKANKIIDTMIDGEQQNQQQIRELTNGLTKGEKK